MASITKERKVLILPGPCMDKQNMAIILVPRTEMGCTGDTNTPHT